MINLKQDILMHNGLRLNYFFQLVNNLKLKLFLFIFLTTRDVSMH